MEFPEYHLKIAEKLESEKLAKINFNPKRIIDLDTLLCDTYDRLSPKEVHYQYRRDLIRIFNMMAKDIYGNSSSPPVVEEYGSFVMDIFNEGSDLDLSINFSDPVELSRQKKIEVLRKFGRKLRLIQKSGHVTALEVIVSAKVPIIKVTDTGTGVECDLSVENWDGIAKSHIIRAISSIDERFQKLCLLMKSWAKAHDINSSRDATLNSLSIVSFVAFHLQTCNPPILPPFSALLKEGANIESVKEIVKTYTNYGNKNKEPLAKLFVTLLVKLASAEKLWQNGYWTSSYIGSWILNISTNRPYSMSVEDFTDRSQNVARAVRAEGFAKIYKCIHNSIDSLSRFLNGEIQRIELMYHLFGKPMVSTVGKPMVSTLGVEGTSTSNINENKNNPPTLQNPAPPKKARLVKNQVRDFQRTESLGTAQVPVPPSSNPLTLQTPRPLKKKRLVKKQVRDLQRTEPSGTAQVHIPPSSIPPTLQNSFPPKNRHLVTNQVSDFQRTEPWGTAQVHVPRSSNVPNGLPSFTPQLPYQSQYQSPFATYSSNFEHHNYVPGNVPTPFALNPVVSQGSHNPSVQSRHGFVQTFHQSPVASNPYHNHSVQSHHGFGQTFHQSPVASKPYHGSLPHSSLQGRDYASLHARDYALYHHRRG